MIKPQISVIMPYFKKKIFLKDQLILSLVKLLKTMRL